MPDLVKFSDLKDSQPLTLNGDDLLAVAHKEQASSTGYSTMTTTPTQLSQYAVEEQTFVNLKTSSKTIENSINQTISNLADDYDNTATYDVDDCVLYEGNLYKCITAIPVEEEWDSTHWEQVKAVDVGSGGGGELPTYEKSASGSAVSFADGGDNIPVKSLIVDIIAVQAGEGTPSPSNPRAISGYTDVVIKNDVQGTTQATYTISLGSTVYMGILNVTTGVLTVTHAYQLFDGSENWQYSESGSGRQRIYLPIAGAMPDSIDIIGNIIEKAAAPTAGYPADWTASFNHNANPSILIGVPSTITSAQDFKDLIANTNLQVVYELSAPVVIQLTPTEVKTLLGENNIFADCGDVEVEYFTEDAKPIADLVEVMDSNEQKHTYSTTEHIVGTWIDGKPIYEKTINCGSLPNNTSKNVARLSDIDLLIDMRGFAYTTGNFRPLPFAGGGNNDIRVDYIMGDLRIVTFSDWSSYTGYVTLQYTKATS